MVSLFSRIPVLERFLCYWREFTAYVGNQLWGFILISFLATLTESVGIGLFFPLLNGLQGGSAPRTVAEQRFAAAIQAVGLEYNVQGILVSIVVVFLLKAVIQFAAGAYQSRIITRFLAALCNRAFDAVSAQEYPFFLSRNLGVLSNMVVNETWRAMVSLSKFAALFPSIITVAIFAVLACRLSPEVTLAAMVFGGVILLLTRGIARYARACSVRNTQAMGHLNGLVLQSFGAFKYLRSTMGLEPLRRQAQLAIGESTHTQFQLSLSSTLTQSLNEPVVILFVVGMFWHQTVIAGHSISQVVVLALFYFRLIKEVMNFQGNWHGFAATLGSMDHISEVIAESERHREIFGGASFTGIAKSIRFDDVSFAYGSRPVLRGLSLTIPRNAMVAVVGESGSGKSTFVDLLTGLQRPSGGRISLDDTAFEKLDIASYRRRIGFVTQEPALFNDTIANNISLWDQGDATTVRRRVTEAARAANCLAFLEAQPDGLDTLLGDRGVNLSGGQRQRVAIARELYKAPDLLILDEATSALDSETEQEIQKSIEALKGRITTVVIAHRLSTIRNADLIYVFSEGKMVEQGDFGALFGSTGSFFRKFCDLQGLR